MCKNLMKTPNYVTNNIYGTYVLLEACKNYNNISKFIYASTDEVYGLTNNESTNDNLTSKLNLILCPTNPYAATKASAEMIAMSYHHSFKVPVIITHMNNIYGENQHSEKIVPKFIGLLQNNEKITIHGDGSQYRALIHISDIVDAFDILICHGNIGETYDITADDDEIHSVCDIAKILINVIKQTDKFDDWIEYIPNRPTNNKNIQLSSHKLKNMHWQPKMKFIDGLTKLVSQTQFH